MFVGYKRSLGIMARNLASMNPVKLAARFRKLAVKNQVAPKAAEFFQQKAERIEMAAKTAKGCLVAPSPSKAPTPVSKPQQHAVRQEFSAKPPNTKTPTSMTVELTAIVKAQTDTIKNLEAQVSKLATEVNKKPKLSNDELLGAATAAFGIANVKNILQQCQSQRADFNERLERVLYLSGIELPHTFSAQATQFGPPKMLGGLARIERSDQQRRVNAWLVSKAK